ncbi:MAG: cytochrome c family protein [Candidatus Marinimicrobia bacterium]|nr:cytochrome c family protein [Candidatus Neomarinimicrobiota bacterium]
MALVVLVTGSFAGDFDYIGSSKCKACHKKAADGEQYQKWEAGPHAGAYETLKSEESAKIAKGKGLKVPAYEAPECLKCHTTGFGEGGFEVKGADFWSAVTEKGEPTKEVKFMTSLAGVGCESCHGAGSEYKSKKTMEGVFSGSIDAASVGLLAPDEKLCKTCHNAESPTYKVFVFAEKSKKIAHPYPAGKR